MNEKENNAAQVALKCEDKQKFFTICASKLKKKFVRWMTVNI